MVYCRYRQYTTEEGHRSVRKLWSFYYPFIGLKCHNYALYFCFMYIYIVKITLTSARCDTVFHIQRWSSDRCRGRLGSVFISFDVGAIDVGGLTWRQVDTSNRRFNCVDGFALLSNISTFSSMHKLHNPDRHWQVLDWRSFFRVMVCSTSFSLSFHIYFDNSVSLIQFTNCWLN